MDVLKASICSRRSILGMNAPGGSIALLSSSNPFLFTAPSWKRTQLHNHFKEGFSRKAIVTLSSKVSQRRTMRPCTAAQNGSTVSVPVFNRMLDSRDLEEPAEGFDRIADALEAISRGEIVVVLDDEDRENEGDLIMAAEHATPEAMAFIVNHTSGVICVGMEGKDLDRLRIPLMISPNDNEEAMSTAFTVTVDLRKGTTTGISASDRVATIKALASPSSQPDDFKRPGHIFPLRYRRGGVLRRPGHTEASVDLAKLAGCHPAGVLCEVVKRDGDMARTPELKEFAKEHGLCCITIADLVRYRLKNDSIVEKTASGELPTRYGKFMAHSYRSCLDGTEHIALVMGNQDALQSRDTTCLVRIHSESMLGDVFGSQRCDSGAQLDAALGAIFADGNGVLVYLRGHQGRGMGLADELQAYANATPEVCASLSAQEEGSFPNDLRDYGVAAHILKDIGVKNVRLLTSNKAKVNSLKSHGIHVNEVLSLPDIVAPPFGVISAGTHV